MPSPFKKYKHWEYSVFDIKLWLEKKGYDTRFCRQGDIDDRHREWREKNNLPTGRFVSKYPKDAINIESTHVYVDFPIIRGKNKLTFANIRFENYPHKTSHEASKEVYGKLVRKFGYKRGENCQSHTHIKDWDKIQEYVRKQKGEPKKKKWFGLFG